jgi:hypothetical protein
MAVEADLRNAVVSPVRGTCDGDRVTEELCSLGSVGYVAERTGALFGRCTCKWLVLNQVMVSANKGGSSQGHRPDQEGQDHSQNHYYF